MRFEDAYTGRTQIRLTRGMPKQCGTSLQVIPAMCMPQNADGVRRYRRQRAYAPPSRGMESAWNAAGRPLRDKGIDSGHGKGDFWHVNFSCSQLHPGHKTVAVLFPGS